MNGLDCTARSWLWPPLSSAVKLVFLFPQNSLRPNIMAVAPKLKWFKSSIFFLNWIANSYQMRMNNGKKIDYNSTFPVGEMWWMLFHRRLDVQFMHYFQQTHLSEVIQQARQHLWGEWSGDVQVRAVPLANCSQGGVGS